MIPSLSMKLVAVTTTALSLISYECNAQLFPWSNLKHYFDQKTREGPGNGGVLTLPGDQLVDSNSHAPSSTELDFQDSFDDSSTASSISKHNHKNLHTPFILSTHTPPQVIDHKLKNHSHKSRESDHRHSDSDQQIFFPYQPIEEERETLKSDENFRKRGSKPSKHREIVSHTTPSPILITQKPLVLLHDGDDDPNKRTLIQNRVSSHKSVSIMPSSSLTLGEQNGRINVGINQQQTQNPSLFITPRPSLMSTSVSLNDKPNHLNNNSKNNHKPKRQRPTIRPELQYSNTEGGGVKEGGKLLKKHNLSKNNDFSSTRSPLFITPAPSKVSSVSPQQDPYPFTRPSNGETLIVESVPSISIALKPSNNNKGATNIRPIFIGGGGNSNNNNNRNNENSSHLGLVDYLVPPRISPTFPDVRPAINQQQNIFNDDKRIENEMTRLKPPLATNVPIVRPKKTNANKKVNADGDKINNHNMRNHNTRVPNKQKNKFHNHKMTHAQDISPENVNLMKNHNNGHHQAVPSYVELSPTRIENPVKNHNSGHYQAAPSYTDLSPTRKENGMKNHNSGHHQAAPSYTDLSPTRKENGMKNHNSGHHQAAPSYTDLSPTRKENSMKNHNSGHHQAAPSYTDLSPTRNENLLKNHNNDPHHAAASHIDEQISSETGFLKTPSHHSTGERVEFQMHGQNGPKSYKFGYDTGKGHNRQFRYEERDKHGHVKGHYGYYNKDGKLQVVNYEADPETGFKANPVDMSPDQN